MENFPTSQLDVTGLLCPLPVLRIQRRLETLPPGAELAVVATDPATRIDVPHFCAETGHILVEQFVNGPNFHYRIRRRPERSV